MRQRSLAVCIHWSLLVAVSLVTTGVSVGHAQTASAAQAAPITIEPQLLSSALQEFSAQSGLQIGFESELAQDLRTRGIEGARTPAEALDALLEGTSLEYRFANEKTVVIRQKGAPQANTAPPARRASSDVAALDTVMVFGTLEEQLSVGSKSGQSLRETPKSVSIVTRERIEEQNLSSLVDVLRQTTGATTSNYSVMDSFYFSRGFRVQTMQLDGGAPVQTGNYGFFLVPDMATYDHVEMLRGVDGMFSGAGEPGGVINLVRKRAKNYNEVNLLASAGRWDFHRLEFDATGPLTDDGKLRGRAVAAYEDKHYFYDRAQSNKSLLFGTVEYDLTPTTLLIGGVNYERRKEDGLGAQGAPRFMDGHQLDLPRRTAFNPDWAHWNTTTREAYARAEQRYGETGVLKLSAAHLQQSNVIDQMIALGEVNPAVGTSRATGTFSRYEASQDLLDLSASGTFDLFGRRHRYTVGADYSTVDGGDRKAYHDARYDWPGSMLVDVFDFNPALYPKPVLLQNGYYKDNGYSQNGYYATLGLQLAKSLRLNLGGRYGEYRLRRQYQDALPDGTLSGNPSITRYDDSKFIPSVALTWDFAKNWSAYASYAETFVVQANMLQGPLPGTPMAPITGGGYELGVKGELLGFLNASAAVYRVRRSGQGAFDERYPYTPGGQGTTCCYVKQADVISQGFDAEVSGVVLPGWQLTLGYTYNDGKYDGPESESSYNTNFLHQNPKHMLKMWTTWQLPGQFQRWSVNLGVVAQGETYVTGWAWPPGASSSVRTHFYEPGYAVWNAAVKYQISDNWSVGLYGDNIFDKSYYQLIGATIANNTYGTPSSYVLTLRGRW